jgi:hypothetical protein
LNTDYPSKTRIAPQEWRFVIVLGFILLALTLIPFIYGYVSTPKDQQFVGLVFNVPDHLQYFSWYREFQHSITIENKLTPEPTKPIFFNLLWWVLGNLGKLSGMDVTQIFQLFRWFAGAVFILTVYWFCSQFFVDIWERRIVTLVITCGGGLGWILVGLKYLVTHGELLFPLDVYRAGTNSFLSIMAFPHFMMANSLIILSLAMVLLSHERKQIRYSIAAAITATILGWQHTYDLIPVYVITLVFAILLLIKEKTIPWSVVWSGIFMGILSGPSALYSVVITRTDPIWKEVLGQFSNAGVFSADPYHLLILVGLPLWVAILTFDGFSHLVERSSRELLVKIWFVGSFFLAYLPVVFQVHLTNCWQVPVGILAMKGLYQHIIPYLQAVKLPRITPERMRWGVTMIFLLAVLPTNLYLLTWRVLDLSRHEYPYYIYDDDRDALNWLEANTSPWEVVFSGLNIGQFIPAYTGNKAFLAHWAQTLHFYDKIDQVSSFYNTETTDAERAALFRQFNIHYLLYGSEERHLGFFDPNTVSYLTRVFDSPRMQVFRVNLDKLP